MLGKGNGWAGVTQVLACLASWCLESTGFASSSLNKGSCVLNNSLVKSWDTGCLSGRRFWCCQLCGCELILTYQRFSSIGRELGEVFKGYWEPTYKPLALTQFPLNLFFLKTVLKILQHAPFLLRSFLFFLVVHVAEGRVLHKLSKHPRWLGFINLTRQATRELKFQNHDHQTGL